MMNSRNTVSVLLLALIALAGCSNIEVPDLRADVEREGIIPADWQPLPMKVGLAPFRAALELDAQRENVENAQRWVFDPDADRLNGIQGLHRQLMDVLAEYRMFESIEVIDGALHDMEPEELQALALRQGLDVVIIPTLVRHDVAYVESNSAYGWNMFLWWMVSPIISWWVADEDFEVNLHVDLRLYPTTQSDSLDSDRLQPPEPIQRSFDDWDEGFNVFSIYTTPNHFTEANWARVGEKLMPIAEVEAGKAALRYITGELRAAAETDEFRAAIRRRVALVIGVDGTGTPPLSLTRFATDDAEAFEAQLVEARHGGVPEVGLKSLTGSRATRRAVEQSAAELAALARSNDDVIVYFSGVGVTGADGKPALVLAQPPVLTEPPEDVPEVSTITLESLLDLLLANRPRTLTLVLDCSFTRPEDRRCATDEAVLNRLRGNGATGNLLEQLAERVEARGTACVILSASEADVDPRRATGALEIDDLSHGLFTFFALQGLGGKADAAEDRTVSTEEFRDYVQRNVSHIAKLEASSQTGWFLIPESRATYRMPALRRE